MDVSLPQCHWIDNGCGKFKETGKKHNGSVNQPMCEIQFMQSNQKGRTEAHKFGQIQPAV